MELSLLYDIAKDAFTVLSSLKGKFINMPDEAKKDLEVVVDELKKIFVAIDNELSDFLSLDFLPKTGYFPQRKILLTMEGHQVRLRLEEARGRCGKITDIYDEHLNKVFSQVFDQKENGDLHSLFGKLRSYDDSMLVAIEMLVNWLNKESSICLGYLDNDEIKQANDLIKMARKEGKDARKQMGEAVIMLERLKNEVGK